VGCGVWGVGCGVWGVGAGVGAVLLHSSYAWLGMLLWPNKDQTVALVAGALPLTHPSIPLPLLHFLCFDSVMTWTWSTRQITLGF
jgi:hypothetical protein